MKPTRQHLNDAALSLATLLGLVRGMTDEQVNEIMSNDEAGMLAKLANDMVLFTPEQK